MPEWKYTYNNTVKADTKEEAIEEIRADLVDETNSPQVISNSMVEVLPRGNWTLCSCGHIAQAHDRDGICSESNCSCIKYDGEIKH